MLILVADTAGSTGGVLLARSETQAVSQDNILAKAQDDIQILGSSDLQSKAFSAQLIPAIAEIMKKNQLHLAAVDAFAVVHGPGSFTGLRVGLSAMKALAEVMARPIIAVSRLAVMAASADRKTEAGLVHAVFDAGRGEFYHGIYRDTGWTCIAECLQTLESLISSLKNTRGAVVASEPAVLNALQDFSPRPIPPVGVKAALPLALAYWKAHRWSEVVSIDANYLRRSDAEIFSKASIEAERAARCASEL